MSFKCNNKTFLTLPNYLFVKKVNTNGEAVGWNKIRWMKYLPDTFSKVLYKHTFSSDNNESDNLNC